MGRLKFDRHDIETEKRAGWRGGESGD